MKTRPTIVYSFRGLLEICRFSNQPVANQVIDILWDIADEIRRKGFFLSPNAESQILALKADNDRLTKHNNILQAQNAELWKHINDNSAFTLLGQAISLVHGTVSFGEGAKLFAQNGIKTGQNRLIATARDLKMLARRKGRQYNQPTQWAIDKGYCVMVVNIGSKGTSYLTVKGMQFLADFLAKKQLPLLALIDKCEALNE